MIEAFQYKVVNSTVVLIRSDATEVVVYEYKTVEEAESTAECYNNLLLIDSLNSTVH